MAGGIAAILNNLYGLFYCAVTQIVIPPQLIHWRMTLTGMLVCIAAAIFYFLLSRVTVFAKQIYLTACLIAFFASLSAPLGETIEGIPGLVVPMHIGTLLILMIILPRFAIAPEAEQNF